MLIWGLFWWTSSLFSEAFGPRSGILLFPWWRSFPDSSNAKADGNPLVPDSSLKTKGKQRQNETEISISNDAYEYLMYNRKHLRDSHGVNIAKSFSLALTMSFSCCILVQFFDLHRTTHTHQEMYAEYIHACYHCNIYCIPNPKGLPCLTPGFRWNRFIT